MKTNPSQQFGITVAGPHVTSEAKDGRRIRLCYCGTHNLLGVYICGIDPDSLAAMHPLAKVSRWPEFVILHFVWQVGMQILAVNSQSVEEATAAECRTLILAAGDVLGTSRHFN